MSTPRVFPSSSFATRRSIWVKNTSADISPTDRECYLCPKHFGPDQFHNRSLRWDAVPRLYDPSDIQRNEICALEESPPREAKAKKRKRKHKNRSPEPEYEEYDSNKSQSNLSPDSPPIPPIKISLLLKKNAQSSTTNVSSPPLITEPATPSPPPPPDDDGIVDFEEEIDRLKDPLSYGKPITKRRDEDVRTRFTEEDDIPIKKLFLGTKAVNSFNTNVPLPPRQPLVVPYSSNSDDDVPDTSQHSEEFKSIVNDVITVCSVAAEAQNGKHSNEVKDEEGSENPLDIEKQTDKTLNSTVSECFSLCNHCDFYASSEESLHKHESEEHNSVQSSNSKVYPFKILTKSDGNQFYLCDFCNFSGKSMGALVTHMIAHFPKENEKGLSIQKYCATIAVSGKNTKNVVTVDMSNGVEGNKDTEIVEIPDDDVVEVNDNLTGIVIANVTGGAHEVSKLFPKSKRKKAAPPKRVSPRKRK